MRRGWGCSNVPADRGLVGFLAALVAGTDAGDPVAAARLRRLAGRQVARIGLDDERADVRFDARGAFRVVAATDGGAGPACRGWSDRATVGQILGGRLEVRDAVLTGRVEVVGTVAQVAAIVAVIEVLLSASVRVPALQDLADELHADPRSAARPPVEAVPWHPDEISSAEVALLARLDLLTDDLEGPRG